MNELKYLKRPIINLRSFYSGPEPMGGTSSINLLKKGLGKKVGDYVTFKTETISTQKETTFNRVPMKLNVEGDRVYLKVKNSIFNPYWKVDSLLQTIISKNPNVNIEKEDIIKWVKTGVLEVKFNVVKKDHGTMWTFNKEQFQKVITRSTNKKRIINSEDDFFLDF
jgi:hypothetical protein